MKISSKVGVSVVMAAMLAVTACNASPTTPNTTDAQRGGDITMASVAAWTGFNPYNPDNATSTGMAIANAIYPSAFHVTGAQTVEVNKDLLSDVEIISEDPQVVRYTIQPDAVWSDGTPITIDDFDYLWKHLNGSNDQLQVTNTSGYSKVTSVEAGDEDGTVDVTFSTPYSDWRSMFSPLLPAHYMATLGDDTTAWNTGLASTPAPGAGPWTIDESKPAQYLVFTHNPNWFGEKPVIDSLTLRVFGDDQAIIQGLSSTDADITFDVRPNVSTIEQLRAVSTLETKLASTSNQQFLMTQMGRPLSGDPDVRKAMAAALDPAAIAKVLFGDDVDGILSNSHIYAPSAAAYEDQKPKEYAKGASEAESILTSSGWVKGSDGIFERGSTRLELEWLVRSEDQLGTQVAQLVQAAFKKAGMQVTLKPVATADGFAALKGGEYDLSLGAYPSSNFPATWYSALYTCDGGYNFARVCDKHVDELFAQAAIELDPAAQAKLVNQIDADLWASVSNIPMWVVPQMVSRSSRLQGVDDQLPKEFQVLAAATWSLTE
ncbi:MAG: ABC transporter family substrate-binding protein [Microbacterium sp.]